MAKKVDATKGNLTKQIFIYTLPLALSTILQNLFSFTDKAILGNMAGTVAVASIAATFTISTLVISGAVGLSGGTSIVLARFVGARNEKNIRSTIDTSLLTAIILGVVVAVAGFFLTPVFLRATGCPEECFKGAMLYMRITLAFAPSTLLYNYGAAIMRALGDTQRPLIYVAIAGVINVVLNIILCLILSQKVVAVAVATAVSNLVSAVLILRRLSKMEDFTKLEIKKMRFDFEMFKRIIRFGVPVSITNLVLPLGNLQITAAINSYGPQAMAGQSAALSIEGFVHAFVTGFGITAMTFIGQNLGANNAERVKKSFWYCILYNTLISGSLGVITYLTGEFWLGIIVGGGAKEAIHYGLLRMQHVILVEFIYAISCVLTSALKAFGYPVLTSITNIVFNLGFRVFWMQFIYPLYPKFSTIMSCYTAAWILNLIFYVIFIAFVFRKYTKYGICKRI